MDTPTTELTGAELLRGAARLLRERAQGYAIPDSPWFVQDGNHGYEVKAIDPQMPGLPFDVAEDIEQRLAEFIASMHPAFALAIARWLDAEAERFEQQLSRVDEQTRRWYASDAPAFAVARTYLAESSTEGSL